MTAEGIPISVIETSTSGWRVRKARSASTTIAAPALENVPTRRLPAERLAIASTSSSAAAICSNAAAARCVERAPGLRQPQRPDAAIDQRRPELALQRRDDLRDRRLGVVEPVGGGGEGAGFADRLQDPELFQFHSFKECYRVICSLQA